jgi:hypothetical protein
MAKPSSASSHREALFIERPCRFSIGTVTGGLNFYPLDTNAYYDIDVFATGDAVTRPAAAPHFSTR